MGRLAGPPTKRQKAKQWRKEVEDTRRIRASYRNIPARPILNPPAARRRGALLWFIEQYYPDGLVVGLKGMPPFTPDMRWLVGRGYLKLSRKIDGRRLSRNAVLLTCAGRELLKSAHPGIEDQRWIYAAAIHAALQ